MNFFLLVTIILVIAFMAMVVLRRKRKKASRSGRYRSPSSVGLMLERPGRKSRKRWAGFRLQPRHVVLGLVVAVMGCWLAAGYFLADGEGSIMVAESTADAALPEQFSYIGGRLDPDASENGSALPSSSIRPAVSVSADSTSSPASVQPSGASSSIMAAAYSTLPTASRLDQVGLMPGQSGGKPAKKVPAKTSQSAAASSAASMKTAAVQTVKAEAKPVAATPAQAKKAAPAKAPAPEKPKLATAKPAPQKGLLASSRLYTVHLGSFGEKGNAENYLAQLAQAGEQAFISESTVDGRLWHRVMSGRFSSRDDAENYGRNLKKRGLTIETGRYLVKSID